MNTKLIWRNSLLVALIVTLIGAFILSMHIQNSDLVVEMTQTELKVDGDIAAKLIKNPKDGYPDFPDTLYDNFQVIPLRNAIGRYANDSAILLRVVIPDTFLFAIWKPIVITAQRVGFKSLSIECKSKQVFWNFFQNTKTKTISIDFLKKYETSLPHLYIYLDADSIIARRTQSWLYSPHLAPGNNQDSIISALFSEKVDIDRISAMKSSYSKSELADFVNALPELPHSPVRISLSVLPTASCIEIASFIKDFDSIRMRNGGLSNSISYQDGLLEFGI